MRQLAQQIMTEIDFVWERSNDFRKSLPLSHSSWLVIFSATISSIRFAFATQC
jgi:hypothetical protein